MGEAAACAEPAEPGPQPMLLEDVAWSMGSSSLSSSVVVVVAAAAAAAEEEEEEEEEAPTPWPWSSRPAASKDEGVEREGVGGAASVESPTCIV
jgi:hypothetical protein